MAEKYQYDTFIPIILTELGNLYFKQSNLQHHNEEHKEALAYYKTAFWKTIESKSLHNLPVIIINLNYIACSEMHFVQTEKERETYDKLSIPDSANLKAFAGHINHGAMLLSQGKLEQALEAFKNTPLESLKTDINNVTSLRVMLNEFIYFVQMEMGQRADALNTLIQTQELVDSSQMTELYGQLAEFYHLQNNQYLADKYELLWWRGTDSIARASQVNSVNQIGFLHEIDKMNEEQKALTLMQQHDRQMLWVVSGFLALALVLLTLLMINRNRIKQKNRVLYENNVELLAADEQRRKLAELQQRTEAEKYGAIRMDEQSAEELWQNIIHVMEYSPEIYDENFSEPRLAELIEAKQNYVSQAINQQKDWNFSSLVTHYRIREACRRMNDTANYSNYTVEGIGQSVGYSSRSHFVKLFKKQTGLTPSDYMKQCRAGTPPALLESLSPVN